MDLTKQYPRSPNEKMVGLVSLARVVDKARASNEGTLGEYDYDCPHDKPLLAFLGVDGPTFAKRVAELKTDDAISNWVRNLIADKTPQQIEAFNAERRAWAPTDAEHQKFFDEFRDKIAPGRTDIKTWFAVLDADEKRSTPVGAAP
jgi:hypothetical protein